MPARIWSEVKPARTRLVFAEKGVGVTDEADAAPARRWGRSSLAVLLVLVPFAIDALIRITNFAEGDTYWQTETGLRILHQHTVFLHESFSWTKPGVANHPNEWGWDVLLGLAYRAGGYTGLGVVTVVGILAVGLAVVWAGKRFAVRMWPLCWTALFCSYGLVPWMAARPQLISYVMLLVQLLVLDDILAARGPRRWWGLLGLFALTAFWVNMHQAALTGIFTCGGGLALWAGTQAVRRELTRRDLTFYSAVMAVVFLGCLASPFGVDVFADSERTRTQSDGLILEWKTVWHAQPVDQASVAFGLVLLVAMFTVWQRGAHTTQHRLHSLWLGASVVLAVLAVDAVRFAPDLILLGLPPLALIMGDVDILQRQRIRPLLVVGVVVVGLVFTRDGLSGLGQTDVPSRALYPTRAMIEAIPAGCHVLNDYNIGGLITLLRWPAVLVSQDGRNDVYGKTLILEERALLHTDNDTAAIDRFGAGCVLAARADGATQGLSRAPQWTLIASDKQYVLYVRRATQ